MNRLEYLRSLSNESFSDKIVLPEWKRKNYDVGVIFFVKRKLWKNAGGFSTNDKKGGHPGLVTVPSRKGSGTIMVVPGTSSEPRGRMMFFCPKKQIQYNEKSFKQKKSSFVLDYWRSVSRNGPFKIGKLHESDTEDLQCKMVQVHRQEYINLAFKE